MTSIATDELALSQLPPAARSCHKFADITIPLLSVYRLCKANLDVTFHRNQVVVTNPQGKRVLLGQLDPKTELYMVSMYDETEQHTLQGENTPVTGHRAHYTLQAKATANSAYTVQAVPTLINFYHATVGYPPIQSWLSAIDKGYFVGWPGLTSERVRKYCTKKIQTTLGHQKLVKQNVKSTKTKLEKQPTKRSVIHNVTVSTIMESELQNLIATDLPGRLSKS